MIIHPIEKGNYIEILSDHNTRSPLIIEIKYILDIKEDRKYAIEVQRTSNINIHLTYTIENRQNLINPALVKKKIFMNVIGKHATEISSLVTNLKNIETNTMYWCKFEVTEDGTKFERYPLIPFFSANEQIVWYNLLMTESNGSIHAIRLQTITNQRILEYDYTNHEGKMWSFLSFDKIELRENSETVNLLYSSEIKVLTEPIKPNKIKRMNSPKDVIFILEGNPVFTFVGVQEPDMILHVEKEIHRQVDVYKNEQKGLTIEHVEASNRSRKCPNCGKKNQLTSVFCNFCGSRIEAICSKCNNQNPTGSKFCNSCGSILN